MKKVCDNFIMKCVAILITSGLIISCVSGCNGDGNERTTYTQSKSSSENYIENSSKDNTTDWPNDESTTEPGTEPTVTEQGETTGPSTEQTTTEPSPTTTKPSPTTTKPSPTTTEPSPTTTKDNLNQNVVISINTPIASGTKSSVANNIIIDYSNASSKGYFMVKNTGTASDTYKVQLIDEDGNKYNYNLNTKGEYEAFTFPSGNGNYTIKVYLFNASTGKGTMKNSAEVSAGNTTQGYTYVTNTVNFTEKSDAVSKSYEICDGLTTDEAKVKAIFKYIVDNIEYDWDRYYNNDDTRNVNADNTLKTKMGVCTDYACLMSVMCRAQKIPTKTVYGYIYPGSNGKQAYHAWNRVYYNGSWHFYDATKNKTSTGSVTYSDSEIY